MKICHLYYINKEMAQENIILLRKHFKTLVKLRIEVNFFN